MWFGRVWRVEVPVVYGFDGEDEVAGGDDRAGLNRQSNFTLTPEVVFCLHEVITTD